MTKGVVNSALQVMKGEPVSTSSDVYSAGIVLWEILSRKEPFEERSTEDMAELVRNITKRKLRPALPADCPAEVWVHACK